MATHQPARRERRLQQFRLTGVQETGVEIGRGSYAAVVELQFKGLKCAGKKLYPHLYGGVGMLQRFEEECELLGQTRHPNIVQFLGVTFEQGTELPTIVMEFMHTTLSSCIDRYGVLPQEVSYSVLGDVATALCYLHGSNPQIIHRDLTANNILLTRDMQAKVSDLGVAKVLGLTPARMTQMTTCPGTPAYMPPESLEHNPTYTTSIDSFSYGVTMVHLLSGRWPLPSSATVVDPLNPGRVTARTEAQRRQEYLDDIGEEHPLMGLVLECLSNSPDHRPNAEDILERVRTAAREHQPVFEDKIAQTRAEHEQRERLEQDREQLQQRLDRYEIAHEFQIQQKRRKLHQIQEEKRRVTTQLESRNKELSITASLISAKDQENQALVGLNSATMQQVQELTAVIKKKDEEIALLHREVEVKVAATDQLEQEIERVVNYLNSTETMRPFLSNYSKTTWTQVEDLPAKMTALQYVVIDSDLYVGGGNTEPQVISICNVFKYNSHQRKWYESPTTPQMYFGLSSISKKPVVIGGATWQTRVITGEVLTYEKDERKWVKSIPPLPTPRYRTCAISSESGIVVCGGINASNSIVNTVEIFLFETGQWHSATPLPSPRAALQCTMIGKRAYFIGGYYPGMNFEESQSDCYYTDYLAHPGETPLEWNSLPDLPLPGCSPASMGGILLAIGGEGDLNGIHCYDPLTGLWLRVGKLPEYRSALIASTLPNGQIIVSGGWNRQKVKNGSTFIMSKLTA